MTHPFTVTDTAENALVIAAPHGAEIMIVAFPHGLNVTVVDRTGEPRKTLFTPWKLLAEYAPLPA